MQISNSFINQRVRVKVCGMTRSEDVRAAVSLGVDAIGVILHADSPRAISVDRARRIRDEVPAFVSLVGVFVDCPKHKIDRISQDVGLDLIQLHGTENDAFGQALSAPFIKAIRAQNKDQVSAAVDQYPNARALLLDPYMKGQHGGTGQRLDYSLWPRSDQKLILAGGLSPTNVAEAVNELNPYAIDLNSGVEVEPGIKDAQLIENALVALGR